MHSPKLGWFLVLAALFACKGSSGNGTLDVKFEEEATQMKVGTALAVPKPFGKGVLYTFMVYNEGVKTAPCKTDLGYEKPVGGTNWAVSLEMSPIGDPVSGREKNVIYPSLMPRFYFVRSKGEFNGSVVNGISNMDLDKAKLTILSIDGDTISARVDADDPAKGSRVVGEFKAKICKPE
ncbi:MAG: hypothetical protein U0263_26090 [Polyangiaceae bacterium]